MSDQFDPYYTWLGIPPEEQPPHYYRLLGIRPLEADRDVITHAMDQRMAYLRTLQSGKHSGDSQRLLNEISAAAVVLLDPPQKARYDANIESLYNLHENLEDYKLKIDDVPFVLQYNKRDMPDVIAVEELEQELNPEKFPSFPAVAVKGDGVFDTLKSVAKLILVELRKR